MAWVSCPLRPNSLSRCLCNNVRNLFHPSTPNGFLSGRGMLCHRGAHKDGFVSIPRETIDRMAWRGVAPGCLRHAAHSGAHRSAPAVAARAEPRIVKSGALAALLHALGRGSRRARDSACVAVANLLRANAGNMVCPPPRRLCHRAGSHCASDPHASAPALLSPLTSGLPATPP